jgi:AraC-like DNA-binding protein/Tfp pilus assembly protein PilF
MLRNKGKLVFLLLIFSSFISAGQSVYTSRLKEAASFLPTGAVQTDSLCRIILGEIIEQQQPHDSFFVQTYFLLGTSNLYQGKLNLALDYYNKSLQHNQRNIIPGQYKACLINTAIIFEKQYRFEEASKTYQKALEFSEQSKDSASIADIWLNLGILSHRMKDDEKALEIFDNTYQYYSARGDTQTMGSIFNNIATCNFPSKPHIAEANLKKSLDLYKRVNDEYYVALTTNNLAELNISQKKFIESRQLLRDNIAFCESKGFLEALSVALRLLGQCEIESGGDLAAAAADLEQSRKLALKTGRTDYQRDIREVEILLQARAGNFEGVKKMLEEYKTMNDESAQENARILNSEFQTIHEVKKITRQKDLLEEGISIRNRQLILSLLALLAAVLAIGIIAAQYIRLRRTMKTMYRMNLEIANGTFFLRDSNIEFDNRQPVEQPEEDEDQPDDKGIYLSNLYVEIVRRIGNGKLYLDPTFSQQNLCDNMNRSQRYVSLALSEVGKTSFPNLVNNFRINEARRLIADNPNISVIELMEKTGFGSRQSFNRHFKVATGFTPSEYQQRAIDDQNQSLQ